MVIYDETEIFVIKSDFYDGFIFAIKIFIIEVDIPSSARTRLSQDPCNCPQPWLRVNNCPEQSRKLALESARRSEPDNHKSTTSLPHPTTMRHCWLLPR